MPIATVSAKGRITLPASFRRALGIKPHSRVMIEDRKGEIVIRLAPDFFELEGFLGKGATPQEEREAIRTAAVKRFLGRK